MAPKKKALQANPSPLDGDEGAANQAVGNPLTSSKNPTSEDLNKENPVLPGSDVVHTEETNEAEREALLAERETAHLHARLAQAKEDTARRQREEETNAEAER